VISALWLLQALLLDANARPHWCQDSARHSVTWATGLMISFDSSTLWY